MAVDQDHASLRTRSAHRLAVSHRRSFKAERSNTGKGKGTSSNGGGGFTPNAQLAAAAGSSSSSSSQVMKQLGLPAEKFLPEEIWTKIFGFLPGFQSRCVARCVCRSWNAILSSPGPPGAQIWGKHSPVFFLDQNGAASADCIALESVGYNLRSEAWERLPPFSRPPPPDRQGRVAFVSAAGGIFCFGTSLEDLAVTLWNPLTGWTAEMQPVKNFGMYYCRIYRSAVVAQGSAGRGISRMARSRQEEQAEFTVFAAGLKSPRDYASTATCVRVFRSGWSAWGPEQCLPDGCNVLVGSVSAAENPGLLYCLVEKSINLRAGMHLLARQRLAVFDLEHGGWTRSEEIVSATALIGGKECVIVPNCISEWDGRMFGTAQLRQDTTEFHFILELLSDGNKEEEKGTTIWKWKLLAYNPYSFSDMCRQSAIATHDGRIVFTQSSQCNADCAVDCSGLRTVYDIKTGGWTELPHSSITRFSSQPGLTKKLNMESLRLCNGVFEPNLEDGPASFPGLATTRLAARCQ